MRFIQDRHKIQVVRHQQRVARGMWGLCKAICWEGENAQQAIPTILILRLIIDIREPKFV